MLTILPILNSLYYWREVLIKCTNNLKFSIDSLDFNHNSFPIQVKGSQSDRFSPSLADAVCPLVEMLMNNKMAKREAAGEQQEEET